MGKGTAVLPLDNPQLQEEEDIDLTAVAGITDKHAKTRGGLIGTLAEIQDNCRYLPEKALRMVSERTGRSLVDVYGVAMFYRSFSLKPRGKHLICGCLGTACHVRGAGRIVEEFERRLGIKAGETTPDRKFTLETVNCLGACALGPVVVIDGQYFSKVRKSGVQQLLNHALESGAKEDEERSRLNFPVDVSCPRCNYSLMDKSFPIDGRPSIRVTVCFGNVHGWLRLSSLYGKSDIQAEHDIPLDTVLRFLCPHCHAALNDTSECQMCGAPMVPLFIHGGGTVCICSRRRCENRRLNLAC